jgi:ParB family chromosome partitioning protein
MNPLAEAAAAAEMVTLPISLINEPRQALRGPERTDPKYAELRESVREKGVLLPVLVRPGNHGTYILIDGMQRFTLSRETGRTTIPARILDVTEVEALELQVICNLHRVDTKPVQFAEQLRLLMVAEPGLKVPRLATRLQVSPAWVYNTLGLLRLDPQVQTLLDEGKMPLANAQALAKLPEKDQADYVPLAMEQTPQEFTPKVTEIARRIKEGGGRKHAKEYIHVDHYQKMSAIKDEIDRGNARRALFKEVRPQTPEEAWRLALEWVLHRDPISVRAKKSKEKALHDQQARKQRELDEEARRRKFET